MARDFVEKVQGRDSVTDKSFSFWKHFRHIRFKILMFLVDTAEAPGASNTIIKCRMFKADCTSYIPWTTFLSISIGAGTDTQASGPECERRAKNFKRRAYG